ncbi:MAG: hypothetical protein FIB01_00390, partial [Gemmatimonadetes bacterium]|nr:hypothetical protein [Gemmatimonadota bacterium]
MESATGSTSQNPDRQLTAAGHGTGATTAQWTRDSNGAAIMGIRWLRGVLVTGCLLWAGSVQAQTSAQLYEQALRKERTEGDLPAAIALYQRVAAGADRELAARALIRAGELYERSGQQEAVKTYRRVVSEFADQQEPARTARERLAALEAKPGAAPAAGGLALRQVTGNNLDPSGMPSADGHYLTFTDWSTGGNLALFDLVAGTNRQLTRSAAVDGGGGYVLASAISRDGKRIAYYWAAPPWVPQVRIINSDGSGARVLFANQDPTVGELQVPDFPPDGQAVAVVLFGPAGLVRFGLLSTADGSFQVLRRLQDAGYPLRMAVSPDGKWIAYDEIVDTITVARDVVIVARDGVEKARISHPFGNQNPIWTPDGRHLLFSSARSGELGLWAARVTEGVAGNPVEVKSNMPWGFTPMGFAGDRLLYQQATGRGDVFAVEFAEQAGRVAGTPVNLLPTYQGRNTKGVWTRDGKKLVYASRRGAVSTSSAGHMVVR